ncbi:MAG: hypothetical protein H3C27_16925 [Opitutaceae bacterium]|nr:hypothetical protein [Opitutaceae bacterium]
MDVARVAQPDRARMMARFLDTLRKRGWQPAVMIAYGVGLVVFALAFANFYIPGKGFTYLMSFGSREEARRIDALKNLNYHVQSDSDGYDAQYYVQIAMDPTLQDPQLLTAIDSLPYRARRILIAWTSHVLGFGQPEAILNVYVLQNALTWFLLAFTLWWWFPPSGWSNFLRWIGVLFSFGLCVSVRNSLVDGPSLFLIAFGVLLLESGRRWGATAVLALGGLGKETNLLGGAALVDWPQDLSRPKRWPVLVAKGLLLVLPFALWLWYIQVTVGPAADLGARNFDWPLAAYGRKWAEVWTGLGQAESWRQGWINCGPLWSALMMVTLTVQMLYLLLRPAPSRAWWRIGCSFAVLMLFLGDAVWEGYPGAASRVLLPMQLAFNVLVPAGRGWLPMLLLGNLTLLAAPAALEPPMGDGYKINGTEALVAQGENGRFRVQFGREWYQPERRGERFWRWSRASANVTLVNPHAFPIEADLTFILASLEPKQVSITRPDGEVLWRGPIGDYETPGAISDLRLAPGRNELHIHSQGEGVNVQHDPRDLDFQLKDWTLNLKPAPTDGAVLMGQSTVLGGADGNLTIVFDDGWFAAERQGSTYWRWSKGPAGIVLHNPHATTVPVRIGFVLNAISRRTVQLQLGDGTLLWEGEVASRQSARVELAQLALQPGANHLNFTSSLPPSGADNDTRLLDLCLKNLVIEAGR